MHTLGDHIRRRRMDLGLRQRDLASQLEVREETVHGWERGLGAPLVRHYGAIVRFLGYDPQPAEGGLTGRLHAARRRLGLTVAEFAARTGFDEGSLSHWASGSRTPSLWMAGRIRAALDQLDGRNAESTVPPSYFDLTRWRRKPPVGVAIRPKTFGERLRAQRLGLGLSMEKLARRVGVSRGTLYRLERDRQKPAEALRRALGRVLSTPAR